MWAAVPFEPLKPWRPNAISTTKPPPRRHSMVVHNIQNREEMGGLGLAVVTAVKPNEPQHPNAVKSKAKTKSPAVAEKKESEEPQRQLSGSDILMALQRATSQKLAQKKKQKSGNYSGAREENLIGSCCLSSNTRPLCIKPEWRDRLQDLERRLDQLAHAHASS